VAASASAPHRLLRGARLGGLASPVVQLVGQVAGDDLVSLAQQGSVSRDPQELEGRPEAPGRS
jgi:hypothetical protein